MKIMNLTQNFYQILVPDTKYLEKSTLFNIVKDSCKGAVIQAIPKQNFKEQIGFEYVNRLSFRADATTLGAAMSGKSFALSAAGAVCHSDDMVNLIFWRE